MQVRSPSPTTLPLEVVLLRSPSLPRPVWVLAAYCLYSNSCSDDNETDRFTLFPHSYQVGMRGYLATRQMLLAGLDAVNINGGFRSWQTQFKTLYGPKL